MSKKVIIIGAGEAGRMVAREILTHPASELEVVGYLDDDPELAGQTLEGHVVLGSCVELVDAVARTGAEEAIIAVPSAPRDFVRRVITLCRDAHVGFRIVPGLMEIIKGPVRIEQIREVHPEDLLGRETVEFDEAEIDRSLSGRRVMVTGAGGSIGGEICRQLGRFRLGELQLLGRGENQIFHIEEELRGAFPELNIRPVIGDIRDADGLAQVFAGSQPEYVYHAAAHKHVHYMEAYPAEAVKNNVFGTANVIRACREAGVDRLVMLSTDKAVRPRGVMGATKRLAEYMMTEASGQAGGTRFICVRFGNVLGSRGSVVPLFVRQIRSGGPVTVSDPEASRYFMTLREACMLVVQASIMGTGGEVFILQMGTPIRIVEIAKDLIALHGLRPDVDVKVRFSGLKAGEKLHEDLVVSGETVEKSAHDYILTARPRLPEGWDQDAILERLRELTLNSDEAGIRDFLASVIPDAELTRR